eukprot:8553181-Alexandrium_andersonii.AAC.1
MGGPVRGRVTGRRPEGGNGCLVGLHRQGLSLLEHPVDHPAPRHQGGRKTAAVAGDEGAGGP